MKELVANCKFVNDEEVFSAGMSPGRKRDTPFPIPRLALTLKYFAIDCFMWNSFTLISEKMRGALEGVGAEVEYFPVDSTLSAPVPRSQNYMVMSVPVTEGISSGYSEIDPRVLAAMDPQFHEFGELFGREPLISSYAEVKHQIFHIQGHLGREYCTDNLAVHVLRAGCTGVRFFDPEHSDIGHPMRFRTLRGIEEEGEWDSINNIERTRIVAEIH
ncbi:hypothetical protein [Sphingomonas sp. 67-41]|uniref:hypothetical protein n=1 Tax=Sphingomonas TaxID=13687 RepID=UPI002579F0E5|nr:hypothetical protein [Sphingomonas sp. 67-41]